MPPAIRLRPAVVQDAAAIVELSTRVQSWLVARGSLQQFGPIRPEIATAYATAGAALLLFEAEVLAGSVFLESERAPVGGRALIEFDALQAPATAGSQRWWLQKLMVAPERQHRGFGVALLTGARDHVEGRGGGRIVLDCWSGNAVLRRFYATNGYALLGEFQEEGFSVAGFMLAVHSAQRAAQSRLITQSDPPG